MGQNVVHLPEEGWCVAQAGEDCPGHFLSFRVQCTKHQVRRIASEASQSLQSQPGASGSDYKSEGFFTWETVVCNGDRRLRKQRRLQGMSCPSLGCATCSFGAKS